ncbi:hypothetical protein P1X15_02630 [Runella sp. MFBS21]|jgi:hypothetical protein|uniref:hypothetical protein n=1 Tax=Runella TaxID=105 RepID=UPI0004291EA6|nr:MULTISPECIES: hypothetical protein [Runella]MDF7816466.1 hypothetical protein [Runella sp. MFBS21]
MKNPSKFSLDELASQGEGFEDISPDEAEELAGGFDRNTGCPSTGNDKNNSCPVSNNSCPPSSASIDLT